MLYVPAVLVLGYRGKEGGIATHCLHAEFNASLQLRPTVRILTWHHVRLCYIVRSLFNELLASAVYFTADIA